MKRYPILIMMLLFSCICFAHSPSSATMVLAEQEDHTWTLQLRASLDAFRKEVNLHFAETPYRSPEEFQAQVLEHCRSRLTISANDDEKLLLDTGVVVLGHETTVFFDKILLPDDLQTIEVVCSIFEDIYKSKLRLLVLKEGVKQKSVFTLTKDNDFSRHLEIREGQMLLRAAEEPTPQGLLVTMYFLILAIAVGGLLIYYNRTIVPKSIV